MQQVFRIGVLMSALLIGMAGCSAMDWLGEKWRGLVARGDQPQEDGADATAQGSADAVHVLFGFDRWDLDKAAQAELLRLTKKLQENPKIKVRLEGYADSVGARDYNLQLTHKRVDAVRRFLVERGVEPARIRAVSLGELPDRGTPKEQATHRRVTIKLLGTSE